MLIHTLIHIFTFVLLITLTISSSPSPSPQPDSISHYSSSSLSPSPSPESGSDTDETLPPTPSPQSGSKDSDDDWYADPSPDARSPKSPVPAPSEASDVTGEMKSEEKKETSGGGMSGGKKVGVAFGLIAAACFVGFGGAVYRKRQQNIRRAQYMHAARLDFGV